MKDIESSTCTGSGHCVARPMYRGFAAFLAIMGVLAILIALKKPYDSGVTHTAGLIAGGLTTLAMLFVAIMGKLPLSLDYFFGSNISRMDLGYDKDEGILPVQRLVRLILMQAVFERVDRIEFRLVSESSQTGFQITFSTSTIEAELTRFAGALFSPCMVVLCNLASLTYYASGSVHGRIKTINPTSEWMLESDDLQQRLSLSKIQNPLKRPSN